MMAVNNLLLKVMTSRTIFAMLEVGTIRKTLVKYTLFCLKMIYQKNYALNGSWTLTLFFELQQLGLENVKINTFS